MRIRTLISHLKSRMALDPKAFRVYSILRILVILTAVRCVFTRNWESFSLCILSLLLFLLPSFFAERLKVIIPAGFQISIYLFIYAAEILGEVNKYYTAIPGWDTMLHTINGFLCAAIGFSLIYILNRGSKSMQLSPLYMSIVAFCFSMTVGVLWEFFEFAMDMLFRLDMQKDFIVNGIASVTLDPSGSQIPVQVNNIARTILELGNGDQVIIEGGYLDIGIIDTMKDLLVNFIGAIVYCVLGFLYAHSRIKYSVAANMTIMPEEEDQLKLPDEENGTAPDNGQSCSEKKLN